MAFANPKLESLKGPLDAQLSLQCIFCQKTCVDQTEFQIHNRSHMKDTGDDIYQCNICSKTFAVPARLTRHYRTHTGEKPFQCEFCSKSFSVKENLSVHRRIHTKERPYKCEICSRAFEHSGKLHRHMRIHTGERPHKCAVCEKTFIQSGQLVIHMRTHTGEKPYVCTICKKGFTCSKQLKVHSRTHTGEKPYSCDICGKSFGYNHVLKLHQVAHYGEKVYKCTICKDTFTSKKSMETHIKNHSDNNNNNSTTTINTTTTSTITSQQSLVKDCVSIADTFTTHLSNEKENDTLRYVLQQPKLEHSQDKHLYNLLTFPQNHYSLATISLEPQQSYYQPQLQPLPQPLSKESEEMKQNVAPDQHNSHELLTPPNSNTTSPTGSPIMETITEVEFENEHNLPLRKRSKMFLNCLSESAGVHEDSNLSVILTRQKEEPRLCVPVRYNSVIQYAKAS